MSNLANAWKVAKNKFETDTGMKKPSETGKVGFGKLTISYRKSTDIEGSLATLDKLFPDSLIDPVGSKKEKEITKAIEELDHAATAYGDLLTRTIKEQKDTFGKGVDSMYRDLKILRASLESCVSDAKRDLAKLVAAREMAESGINTQRGQIVQALKTLKESLDAAVKASAVRAQNLLKEPTPAAFNTAFASGKAAREVTQALSNIAKYAMPEDTSPHTRSRAVEAMQDEGVYTAVWELYHKVEGLKGRIAPMVKETGTSPLDASIAMMANHPLFFDPNASRDDVVNGTKHFITQLKAAAEISAAMH